MNMLKKQVLVSVTGKSHAEDEKPDMVRLLTTGTLTEEKNAWRIDYTETQPDNQSHDVTVTLNKGVVTMLRHGAYSTSMVFEKGRRFEGSYVTPFGALDMGVYATQVRYHMTDDSSGEIQLKYQLDLQGQFAAMHELQIKFCPSGKA